MMCNAKNTSRMYLNAVSDLEKRKPMTLIRVMNEKLNIINESSKEPQCYLNTSTSSTMPIIISKVDGIMPMQKSAATIPHT